MRAVAVRKTFLTAATILASAACSEAPTRPTASPAPISAAGIAQADFDLDRWLRDYLENPSSAAPGPSVMVGAGDIAECYTGNPPPLPDARTDAMQSPAEATAKLLDRIPGTVITIGDNAYKFGTPFDFRACYHPTWGRHRDRTRPSTGNHEYMTPAAAGYFGYFGARAAPPLGYYSYNLASWHVIVLNSTPQVYACYPPEADDAEEEVKRMPWWGPVQLPSLPTSSTLGRACAGDAAQQAWLVADLTKHSGYKCTLVYFHHPRFSSGSHGNHYQMQRIWDILYAYGADVVLSAHDHNYERFARQNPDGGADGSHGIREFVVGTGGGHLRAVGLPIPNSERLFTGVFGVLALALGEGEYSWVFLATDGTVQDAPEGIDGATPVPDDQRQCHDAPASPPVLPFTVGS
jgi:hypothetical protein